MFTRREYASSSLLPPGPSPASGYDKGGFKRIGNGRTTSANNPRTILDRVGLYSVSASGEQHVENKDIAMGQVHMRQDVNVIEDERWNAV